jgi:hypothetical protein
MMTFFIDFHPKGEPEAFICNALRGVSVVYLLYATDCTAYRYSMKRGNIQVSGEFVIWSKRGQEVSDDM